MAQRQDQSDDVPLSGNAEGMQPPSISPPAERSPSSFVPPEPTKEEHATPPPLGTAVQLISNGDPSALPPSVPAGILTGEEIVEKGLVEDPDPSTRKERIKPASYDLRIGQDVFICGKGNVHVTRLNDLDPTVCIEPFGTILFGTKELVNTQEHNNIVGHFGLRVTLSLQGLILQVGPQVDPGYRGKLFGLLLNTTATPRYLNLDEKVVTIEFCYTTRPCSFPKVNIESMAQFLKIKGIDWGALAAPNIIRQHEEEVVAATKEIEKMRTEIYQLVSQYTANEGVKAGTQGVIATKKGIYFAIGLGIFSIIVSTSVSIWGVYKTSPSGSVPANSYGLPASQTDSRKAVQATSTVIRQNQPDPTTAGSPTTNRSKK